tara:strand:+ start:6655 stop:6855 length:201 start_codon:yes stop_codon:yes gene_type:complete
MKMTKINLRLRDDTLAYFQEMPNLSNAIRKVLEGHVARVQANDAAQTITNQQRWGDLLAEENDNEI